MGPFNCGIDPASLSGWEKFEGPDPAEWVPRGYAIINIDARGSFDSEGVFKSRWISDNCWLSLQG
jgi:predicted acyl esterase